MGVAEHEVVLMIPFTWYILYFEKGKFQIYPSNFTNFQNNPAIFHISRFAHVIQTFSRLSMKNAPSPSKTPSINRVYNATNVIESYAAGLLIASRQVLRECPVASHLEHLNARFGRSSC